MTFAELVAHLAERGARLSLDGDRVRVSAPRGALSEEILAELSARKEELRQWLQRSPNDGPPRPPLRPRSVPPRLPLSFAQQRLWLIDQVQRGSSTEYNIPSALRLRGALDHRTLQRTIDTIVERHDSLRTRFGVVDGEPIQIIEPYLRVPIPVEDLSALDAAGQDAVVHAAIQQEWQQPFDLAHGPVLRVRLLELGDRDHVLIRSLHHIVSDGWSGAIFDREFVALYEAFQAGRPNPLPPLPVQYGDFTLWQQEMLDERTVQNGLDYWRDKLAGIPDDLALPTDRPRPAAATYAADMCGGPLNPALAASLAGFARSNQATVFMVLVAALASLLERYTGQHDVVIGSPIANRQDPTLENLIGFFANTLALRVDASPRRTFRQLVTAVRQTTLDAYVHQDLPFARLVEELAPARRLNTTPLFQVVITM
jgi:Condensation domain/TubC N-terminal docking domain